MNTLFTTVGLRAKNPGRSGLCSCSPSMFRVFVLAAVWVPGVAWAGDAVEAWEALGTNLPTIDRVVWALNIGGAKYTDRDGLHYYADQAGTGGERGSIDRILGAQDSFIYQSYRSGDIRVERPIANGIYDITFQFAEPEDIATGERVFDVFAEDQRLIKGLDVRLARDGRHLSALTRTVTDVEVTDGQLDIVLAAVAGEPLLNGLVVRTKAVERREWALLWADEFDYRGPPDSGKWNVDVWKPGKVNSEDQAYTDRAKNVRVVDGKLVIEAHRESYGDAGYTSGRVQSQGKGDFLYGRVDIRARIPAGQGTWSALWMLPSDPYRYSTRCSDGEEWQGSSSCDAWPNSGEIDIMEHVGYDMNRVHGTVHNKAYYWKNKEQRKGSVEGRNVDQAFHVYSLEWTPEHIDIYFDGSLYFSYFNQSTGWEAWPYDHPYHIILNQAVGGDWGRAGGPIDDRIFPTRLEVDYVRIFKPVTAQARP
ncbi:MAG: family 16 glycosylhydrolase [Halioglobus sp.]